MSLKNCIIVLWVYVMYVLGIWMFSSGYLLKRIVVHQNSTRVINVGSHITCRNYSTLSSVSNQLFKTNEVVETLRTTSDIQFKSILQNFDRSIIILVDALRYDFTLYHEDDDDVKGSHHLNKMPIFSNICKTHPKHALHIKLFADPPTTTLQRLQGITTGSLPTFIDLSLNFASSAISEDNLIHQLNRFNRNVVFMGDETWESLFPGQFYRSYPFPSFNVKDLDSVDNGILNHIYLEMEKDDWSVVIAHFVGVDHCGHRYGPSHPAMETKLRQMNDIIEKISRKIKNDTLMVVLGDHGMTSSGDHGGDSDDELTTTLFLYSPKILIQENDEEQVAYQVDLVPTLSILLGLPIPFSSLGSAIIQPLNICTQDENEYCFDKSIDPLLGKTLALAENVFQVRSYLKEYSKFTKELPYSVFLEAETSLQNSSLLWNHMGKEINLTISNLQILLKDYANYLKFVREECSKTWATFNLEAMLCGIVIFTIAVLLNLILSQHMEINFHILKLLFVILGISSIIYLLYFRKPYIFILLSLGILFMCRKYLETCTLKLFVVSNNMAKLPTVVTIMFFLSSMSNSYVVYEDTVICYFLQSMIAYQFFPTVLRTIMSTILQGHDRTKRTKPLNRKIAVMNYLPLALFLCLVVCIRVVSVFNKCREEQQFCESSSFLVSLANLAPESSTFKAVRLSLSWLSVATPILAAILSAKWTMQEKNYTAAIICINYGIVFIGICISLHWWLSTIPTPILDRILGGNQMMTARCALAVSVIVFFITWLFPFLPEKPWESQPNHLFSGSICLFTLSILMPLYLTAGDGLALSLTFVVITLVIYLTFNSFVEDDSESKTWTNVVTWSLISCHWFYSTGHQPTFPAIQWDAAFVFQKEVSSYVFAGFCVILNTFSSHILLGITLPLLLTWTRPPKDPEENLLQLLLTYICFHGIKLLGAMVACFILRRHLMVWKIFTPKLIYEVIGMIITMLSAMLGYLFTLRVTSCYHRQIKNNFGQLWSQKPD